MKKRILLLIAICVGMCHASAFAELLEKAGNCIVQEAGAFDDKKIFSVILENADIKAVCEFRGSNFFDNFHLFAIPKLYNKSGRILNVSYQARFFDVNGDFIEQVKQNIEELDADARNFQLGSCLTEISPEDLARIQSYKVTMKVE